MKYIVEVNAKWLISIEAESALNAEHKLLDYNGVWGANAYDQKAMKTDTFAGAVQFDEFVSMNELITMVNDIADKKVLAIKAKSEADENRAVIEEMEKRLQELKKAQLNLDRAYSDAKYSFDRAEEKLGKARQ